MIESTGLDEETRAKLLCYLAIAQLVSRARGGDWLRKDHLVESTRIWLAGNGAKANWSERVQLGTLSERIALDLTGLPDFADAEYLARLFTDGWRLDHRSPVVRGIYSACVAKLSGEA
ncbi:hypothetical protein PQR57_29450 [Paraburkholderia dipogonis]|uniref:Uncharacterized protein n=1 Tax=Paraburkholderia dipogonis TaxID=1211383 RepID=A0ABW9AYN4_9BURK